jgi:hypothetical protein
VGQVLAVSQDPPFAKNSAATIHTALTLVLAFSDCDWSSSAFTSYIIDGKIHVSASPRSILHHCARCQVHDTSKLRGLKYSLTPVVDTLSMALRHSIGQLPRSLSGKSSSLGQSTKPLWLPRHTKHQLRHLATPVPPVTQNAAGSRGPTAMVFLNMGGPSTVDEVGDFLSRLFVRLDLICIELTSDNLTRQMAI